MLAIGKVKLMQWFLIFNLLAFLTILQIVREVMYTRDWKRKLLQRFSLETSP